MSLLRNVLTYMGLGPDEDYDDGYRYDGPDQRPRAQASSGPDPEDEDPELDPHAPRPRPASLDPGGGDGLFDDDDDDVASVIDLTGLDSTGLDSTGLDSTGQDPEPDPGSGGGDDPFGPVDTWSDGGEEPGPDRAAGRRGELRLPPAAARPLRAVPPDRDGPGVGPADEDRGSADDGHRDRAGAGDRRPDLTDLVQPEHGITVRTVPIEAEADMAGQVGATGGSRTVVREVTPRVQVPDSFGDAKALADDFKAAVPVVLNLRRVDRELARRFIDFASGICYALDGAMEKLAPQVFLLTPPGVEVGDGERRRLERRGFDR